MDEKAQKEALKELNKSLEEDIKKRNKKVLFILIIYLFLAITFQTIIGVLPGENPDLFGFRLFHIKSIELKERYNIFIDDSIKVGHVISKDFSFPLVPFLINIVDGSSDTVGSDEVIKLKPNNNNKLKVIVYKCYSNYAGVPVNEECDRNTVKYEEVDVKNKIKIVKELYPEDEVLYDGKFISDIGEYINEKGKYKITIYNKKWFTRTTVWFYLEVSDDEEIQ